jgi:hypothetical protein
MCSIVSAEVSILELVDLAKGITIVGELDIAHKCTPGFRFLVRVPLLNRRLLISGCLDIGGHEV